MYHVVSPWPVTCAAITTAMITPPISKPLKTSGIGPGPRKNEHSTSTGATNSAICALEPIEMLTARSILFFIATSTATQCSAALPTMATTITPMKNSDRPTACEASLIEPTSTSDITPTRTPATARATTEVRVDHPQVPSSAYSGLKMS